MMNRIRYKLSQFMQGRYGVDNLSRFLSAVLLVYLLVTMFLPFPYSSALSLVMVAVIYLRTFSRNIPKRYEENRKFLHLRDRVSSFFRNFRSDFAQRREYHIYKCPRCSQKIRIPRGKGRIMVRCPRCGDEFKKRS